MVRALFSACGSLVAAIFTLVCAVCLLVPAIFFLGTLILLGLVAAAAIYILIQIFLTVV